MAGDDQSEGRCSKGLLLKSQENIKSMMQPDLRNWENSRDFQFSIPMEMGGFWKWSNGHIISRLVWEWSLPWLCECSWWTTDVPGCTIKQQFYAWWCLDFKKFRHQPSMDLRGRFTLRPKVYIGYDKNEPIFGREWLIPLFIALGINPLSSYYT